MNRSPAMPRRPVHQAERLGQEAATNQWVTTLARWGYAAKGFVYLIIGFLAARLAFGAGGETTSRTGALRAIDVGPLGRVLLTIVAVGLVGYALWSLLRAVVDPEGEGTDAKGLATRAGFGVIALSYATSAYAALQIILGTGSGGGGGGSNSSTRGWTARLLELPFGVALVVIVGLIVIGVAGLLGYRAYTGKFGKRLDLSRLGSGGQQAVMVLGRCGYAALGVVFAIVGVFLVVAAAQHNPGQAKGLGGALADLARQPYGHVLLAIVALGLIAFGLYSLVEARYRRFARS